VDECKPLPRGGGGGGGNHHGGGGGGGGGGARGCDGGARGAHGRAVQLDPIKPKLKAPRFKRLKLRYDYLLLSFAYKFNLRRYNMGAARAKQVSEFPTAFDWAKVPQVMVGPGTS